MNYKRIYNRFLHLRILFIYGFASILILCFTTCGKEYLFATKSDCNDCITPRPDYGLIHIKLSPDVSSDSILVMVFKGRFTEKMLQDNSDLIYTGVTKKSTLDVDVSLDTYYSVVAKYKVGDKTYYVVDGDKIKLYDIESTCETDCWIIRGGKMNCTYKF